MKRPSTLIKWGLVLAACGGTSPVATGSTGEAGGETSPCIDGMCEEGLVCLSNLCVEPEPGQTQGESTGISSTSMPPPTSTTVSPETTDTSGAESDSTTAAPVDTTTTGDPPGSTSDDPGSSGGSTTTSDVEVGFGTCFPDDECLGSELCLQIDVGGTFGPSPDHGTFCSGQGCDTAADCPEPPPGGDPVIGCTDVTGDGVDDCYLWCGGGETCPDGMYCALDAFCAHTSTWTCYFGWYDSGTCDCGCGIPDPDCPDMDIDSCEDCGVPGSCNGAGGACPGAIDPANPTQCDPLLLWDCDPAAYADGAVCDCGCGAFDPDCDDATTASCDACNGLGSCAATELDCGTIAEDNNPHCAPPAGWTCSEFYYGDGECDCGCGVIDFDCPDASVTSCLWCNLPGSCGEGGPTCPGNIDPDDNSQCAE